MLDSNPSPDDGSEFPSQFNDPRLLVPDNNVPGPKAKMDIVIDLMAFCHHFRIQVTTIDEVVEMEYYGVYKAALALKRAAVALRAGESIKFEALACPNSEEKEL